MRANQTNRRLRAWRKLTGIATAAALALSVLGGGTVTATTPTWPVGHGTDSSLPQAQQPESGASPSLVSAGDQVGFFEWLRNDERNNISQLFLRETTGDSVAGARWHIEDASGNPVPGREGICAATTPLYCSFGALNSGQTIYLIAAFDVPASLVAATFAVNFEWNSTGTPPGENESNGDVVPLGDNVLTTATTDADRDGDFNFSDPAPFTVDTDPALSSANKQATSVTVTRSATGIAVSDSPSATLPCTDGVPAKFRCSSLTSLTSLLEVGNGATISDLGRPRIKVVVSFLKIPSQLKGSNRFAYHSFLDAAGAEQVELITANCAFDTLGLPTNTSPCLTVVNNQVTVWVTHNGGMRF